MSYQQRLIRERREEIAQAARDKQDHERAGNSARPAKVFYSQSESSITGLDTWTGGFKTG
jgi:hypothetical protein